MQDLQTKLGHQFNDTTLLARALRHRSCGDDNNERLEFLGDSILNFIAAEMIYEMFPSLPEGNMSRVRAGLVRQSTLAIVAERIGVARHLQVSHHDRTTTVHAAMLADALEALFAGVYLDAGIDAARRVIRHHMMTLLSNGEAILKKDPKTALQELLQGRGLALPTYAVVAENEHLQERRYEASCAIPVLKIRTTGFGATRKQAESAAAQQAMHACQR